MNQPAHTDIPRILKSGRTVAVVGLSADAHRPSFMVAKYLHDHGYTVVPVNPRYDEVLGRRCFPTLASVEVPVDIVDVFRKTEDVWPIAEQALTIGAKCLWQQIGVHNQAAADLFLAAGRDAVQNRCIKIEHARCFGDLHWTHIHTAIGS